MNTPSFIERYARVVALAAVIAGVVFLFAGWWGVSGSDLTTEQIPYLASGAVGGLFFLGIAATLWVSADLRDEYGKLDEISRLMRDGQRNGGGGTIVPVEPAPEPFVAPVLGVDDAYPVEPELVVAPVARTRRAPRLTAKEVAGNGNGNGNGSARRRAAVTSGAGGAGDGKVAS